MERVAKFLKEAETYYLATVEGDQPRVRPFGTAHIFEGKLYIQTDFMMKWSKIIKKKEKRGRYFFIMPRRCTSGKPRSG